MRVDLVATYRLQLTAAWGLNEAAEAADYLADLGISHVYTSPCLQAAAGSTHGYDVVDPTHVSEELGGREAFVRFCKARKHVGLGWVLDIVPNHMAIAGRANPWWWDVLEDGPWSLYASHFDIYWQPSDDPSREVILLPVLGQPLEQALESGALQLARDGGWLLLRYYDREFPLSPASTADLLARAAQQGGGEELTSIAQALEHLAHAGPADYEGRARRYREKAAVHERLDHLCRTKPRTAQAVDAILEKTTADEKALGRLLDRQHYRLAFWRTAQQRVGYRRFFEIDTLVGLRIENARVFDDVHRKTLEWVREGHLDGLRVDHIDGLADPQGYLDHLAASAPDVWRIVEKILEPSERLRASWPVAGTTGYDFLNVMTGLFVDPAGEGPLTELYSRFIGQDADFEACAIEKKRLVLRTGLAGDVNHLAEMLQAIARSHPAHRDRTLTDWADALIELIVAFPVYRTYVQPARGVVHEEDLHVVTRAVQSARRQRPDLDNAMLDFLQDILTLQIRGEQENAFVTRFQQLTGPAMAKGVEDTVFYCFNRLGALNEVGGDPGRFGVRPVSFHAFCAEALARWPRTMLADSTHDTKRSQDVRARLCLLSEMPRAWAEAVGRWATINERYRRDGMPSRNDEYLFYQTLVGAWPIDVERLTAYMLKAARETKTHTSWLDPEPAYEDRLRGFVAGAMDDEAFTADVEAFVAPLIGMGRVNSLAQTLLKLTAPGVPDIYQGTELWDLSLVDPDNRRPVDYAARRRLLAEARPLTADQVWERVEEGLPKLFVIDKTLALRRQCPEAFGPHGDYAPLNAHGDKAAHVVAFIRGGQVATVVPRLITHLDGRWGDTVLDLPEGTWVNILTDAPVGSERIRLSELFSRFPIALLHRKDQSQ